MSKSLHDRIAVVAISPYGYSASIPNSPAFGSCWGADEKDARRAMEWFYKDMAGSEDVALAYVGDGGFEYK